MIENRHQVRLLMYSCPFPFVRKDGTTWDDAVGRGLEGKLLIGCPCGVFSHLEMSGMVFTREFNSDRGAENTKKKERKAFGETVQRISILDEGCRTKRMLSLEGWTPQRLWSSQLNPSVMKPQRRSGH